MTRGDIKTRVARVLGVSVGTDSDSFDENDFINGLINEAVLDVLSRTRVHVRHAQIALTAPDTEYDIDDTILRINKVFRNTDVELLPQPIDQLDSSGYCFPGFSRIILGLAPSAGDVLDIWYTPTPTAMTDDGNDPSALAYGRIPPQFHRALFDYTAWNMADKMGDAGAGRGERYRILYEGQDGMGTGGCDLGRIKTYTNMRGGALVRVRSPRWILFGDLSPTRWQG